MDRDGEVFPTLFSVDTQGNHPSSRFVEPDQIKTPKELAKFPAANFGIQTEPEDVESVLGYFIDGEPVRRELRSSIARRTSIATSKRGLPLYYSRAEEPASHRKTAAEHELW